MSQRIDSIVKDLSGDPSVVGLIIYRVDGTPVFVRVNDEMKVLQHMYFLESQIKSVLSYIFTQNLNEISIKVEDIKILLLPITKTLVMSILFFPTAEYRLEMEAKRLINTLKPVLANEI